MGKNSRPHKATSRQAKIKRSKNRLRAIVEANRCFTSGDFAQGIQHCQSILARWPEEPEAFYLLGTVAGNKGNFGAAIEYFEKAIAEDDCQAKYFDSLGLAQFKVGRLEDASESFRSAIRMDPQQATAHYNLGNLYLETGEYDEAIRFFESALRLRPSHIDALNNEGSALLSLKDSAKARACFEKALEMAPSRADIWCNLGTSKLQLGITEGAETCFLEALRREPVSASVNYNVGYFYETVWNLSKAAEHYDKAVRLGSGYEALNNIVNVLNGLGRIREALESAKKLCSRSGPDQPIHISNFLLISHYSPDFNPEEIFRLHKDWGSRISGSIDTLPRISLRERASGRPLKVGYVSRDFHEHSVAYFIESVLAGHDPERVSVYCYSDTEIVDSVNERLRGSVPSWCDIHEMSHAEVADRIRRDEIDILVDLGGHTGKNRLPVFAAKPAPIQATYLGYPNTTGLPEIDYRITDAVADPPSLTDMYHTEKLARLDSCFLCYRPSDAALSLEQAPFEQQHRITFGCFNIYTKINDKTLAIWAKILQQIPNSRLVLKSPHLADQAISEKLLAFFEEAGIDRQRIELLLKTKTAEEHLALYSKLDIALDTHPYNGTTTTCEALWMGVPVLTLAGMTHVSRVGASILTGLDKQELIALSEDEYLEKAIELANQPEKIRRYRETLRSDMQQSPLMDRHRIVSELEDLYEHWVDATAQ